MRQFLDLMRRLDEAIAAPAKLYHGTNLFNLIAIFEHGAILTSADETIAAWRLR